MYPEFTVVGTFPYSTLFIIPSTLAFTKLAMHEDVVGVNGAIRVPIVQSTHRGSIGDPFCRYDEGQKRKKKERRKKRKKKKRKEKKRLEME